MHEYTNPVTNGLTHKSKQVNGASSSYDEDRAANEIRKFVIGIYRQNGGGHSGSGELLSMLMCCTLVGELSKLKCFWELKPLRLPVLAYAFRYFST